MAQNAMENKNRKGLYETITFCGGINIQLITGWLFEAYLSHGFIAFAILGIFITLIFTFIIGFVASLVYATRVKELSWMVLIPSLINVVTIFSIIYLIQIKNR